jgi:hypothetical protein
VGDEVNREEAITKARIQAAAENRILFVKPYDGTSHPRFDNTFVIRKTPCTIQGYAKVYPNGIVEEVS